MADGGRTGEVLGVVEVAARRLAAAYGTGSFLRCAVWELGDVPHEQRGETTGIRWRGTREESAARSVRGSSRAAALHNWSRAKGVTAMPAFAPDPDAAVALNAAEMVPAALMRVYAIEAWHEWPLVERAALVVITGRGSREAVCDAMARILWRVAAVSQDDRARELHMRADRYRALTRKAERLLRGWLKRAAVAMLPALKSGENRVYRTGSDPCGIRRETWWRPDGFAPRKQHK